MQVEVSFPGNKKVRAECAGFVVETDQPAERGGDGTAPSPFDLFLCSLAACTGFHVLSFLQERGLSTADAGVTVSARRAPGPPLIESVTIEINTPKDFPEKYADAMVRAAEQCAVRRQLGCPPDFAVSVVLSDERNG